MNMARDLFFVAVLGIPANAQSIVIDSPSPPPDWALSRENAGAAIEFAAKYVDPNGHFRGVERWGRSDGPDDRMDTFHNWPLAHAFGSDRLPRTYERIWEGHLDPLQNGGSHRAGVRLIVGMPRYTNRPAVDFPWGRQ
jgi:hypothetical protein